MIIIFISVQNEPIEAVLIKESLTMATIGKMMMVMNKHELNLFGVSRMASNNQKRCQMIFRQSNVSYSRYLCLHLSGIMLNHFPTKEIITFCNSNFSLSDLQYKI